MNALSEKIKALAAQNFDHCVADRRHLHANPELSFKEKETAAYVARTLEEIGLNPQTDIGGHGLTAVLEGAEPSSKIIALRADMDALPIVEANEVSYKSKNEGVMHACGHDAHTASLLNVARILSELKSEFKGSVKFIFQPAEERHPGGASLMIADGALQNPNPQSILGQHVHPPLEAGKIGFRSGPYMASADELYFTVKGKGGHAAQPHLQIDTVVMASQLVLSLQRIVSRFASPDEPCVLSIGKFIAEGATNVIPQFAKLDGTLRCFNDEMRFRIHDEIRRVCAGVALTFGGEIEPEILVGYPALINHEALTARTRKAAEEFLGKENVVDLELTMGAEDFAYYSQQMDACFYRLGTGNQEKGITSAIHTPTFDIDEKSLEVGPALMSYLAVKELEQIS